jgi:hypothetical protein
MKRLGCGLLLAAIVLSGCNKEAGPPPDLNAQAMGYACRASLKSPEQCMKENEAMPPADILIGWKDASDDIKSGDLKLNFDRKPEPQSANEMQQQAAGKKNDEHH